MVRKDLNDVDELMEYLKNKTLNAEDPKDTEMYARAYNELLRAKNSEDQQAEKSAKDEARDKYQKEKDKKELVVKILIGAANIVVNVGLTILLGKWENGGHLFTLNGSKDLQKSVHKKALDGIKI